MFKFLCGRFPVLCGQAIISSFSLFKHLYSCWLLFFFLLFKFQENIGSTTGEHEDIATHDGDIQRDERLAVQIKAGYKSYGRFAVLKSLDLNVPQGAMLVTFKTKKKL